MATKKSTQTSTNQREQSWREPATAARDKVCELLNRVETIEEARGDTTGMVLRLVGKAAIEFGEAPVLTSTAFLKAAFYAEALLTGAMNLPGDALAPEAAPFAEHARRILDALTDMLFGKTDSTKLMAATADADRHASQRETWTALASKAQETASTLLSAVSELSEGVHGELEDFSRLTTMASKLLTAQDPDDQDAFEAATFEVMALIRGAVAAGGASVSSENRLIVEVASEALDKLTTLATLPGRQPLLQDFVDAQGAVDAAAAAANALHSVQEAHASLPARGQEAAPLPASSASGDEFDDEIPAHAVFHEVVFHRTDLETYDVPAHVLHKLTGRTRDIARGCRQVLQLIEWDEYHSDTGLDDARPAVLDVDQRSVLTRLVSSSLDLLQESCDHHDEREGSRQKSLDRPERQASSRHADEAMAA